VERRRREGKRKRRKGDEEKVDCPYNAHYSLPLESIAKK